jgi:hypothetical protein
MPDISGFTAFVHETELQHSQEIISGLLETLIDANQLSLTVAEIEGDAVLFYKEGQVPEAAQVLAQARHMFGAFHGWVADFQSSCTCSCDACQAVGRLTLKVVAHAGPLGFTTVRQHRKPFGEAVVLVHRLLKNDVPSHEYLLLTDDLLGAEWPVAAAWAGARHRYASYAGLGLVGYVHVLLRDAVRPKKLDLVSTRYSLKTLWANLVQLFAGRPAMS